MNFLIKPQYFGPNCDGRYHQAIWVFPNGYGLSALWDHPADGFYLKAFKEDPSGVKHLSGLIMKGRIFKHDSIDTTDAYHLYDLDELENVISKIQIASDASFSTNASIIEEERRILGPIALLQQYSSKVALSSYGHARVPTLEEVFSCHNIRYPEDIKDFILLGAFWYGHEVADFKLHKDAPKIRWIESFLLLKKENLLFIACSDFAKNNGIPIAKAALLSSISHQLPLAVTKWINSIQ